ncbi:UDP-glucose 6-dehydrogenase [Actinotignum sanguinis]|uniref:nucleotide sugar dehydrogenase n=1 Tax=Actinotignum sanguinis TaxID=1445614 RepID=UPI000F7DF1D7|nr:nucleotide sugar dehydrogenase [Actinotignum sanguinis]MDY5147749.1 nucleotide sugar dehydrogenase [Actinotignum sanguinis]RTE50437.1 UDP-glucose 6-dehydrogenase [Actinotignum sanguinis]
MQIAVIGLGYVGLANAVLLAQHHDVVGSDLNPAKVDAINARTSPIQDARIEEFLATKPLSLRATTSNIEALAGADYAVIATPTDYDTETNAFDTASVESAIAQVAEANPSAVVVIKSTIPIGFTARMQETFPQLRIVFSPEFLREGKALQDNLNPSRIVVSGDDAAAAHFAQLLSEGAEARDVPIIQVGTREAEAIKLFSNTYLAMRVAYFNELDSFALARGLNAAEIIRGVGLDPRIGDHYNNPSFGYGGYCLPKDTKELRADFQGVPENLVSAIVESNDTRIEFLASRLASAGYATVGIYKVAMKSGSDNHRASAALSLAAQLHARGVGVLVYDPALAPGALGDIPVLDSWEEFQDRADVIITNRLDGTMPETSTPVLTRDIFGRD